MHLLQAEVAQLMGQTQSHWQFWWSAQIILCICMHHENLYRLSNDLQAWPCDGKCNLLQYEGAELVGQTLTLQSHEQYRWSEQIIL